MRNEKVGEILKLFISTPQSSKRVEKSAITIDPMGVIEDKFYAKDSARSILLTSKESYDLIKGYDIEMPFGYLGENLLMDYNPYSLPMGSRLKIGGAIIEISQNCTICNHLSVIDKRIPKLLKNDRGIFAKTVQSGEICVGDSIYLL